MSRLPIVGGDTGLWGEILNDFLSVSLNSDGTLKSGAVGPAAATDNAIARFDGITGKLLQDSGLVITDLNHIEGSGVEIINTDTTGKQAQFYAVNSDSTHDGGAIAICAGNTTAPTKYGGNLTLQAGNALASGSTGGKIFLTAGDTIGPGTAGGSISLLAGRVYSAAGTDTPAGDIYLETQRGETVANSKWGMLYFNGDSFVLEKNNSNVTATVNLQTITSNTVVDFPSAATGQLVVDSATQTLTNKTLTTPKIDAINEATTDNGVNVDGVLIKDGQISMSSLAAGGTIYAESALQYTVSTPAYAPETLTGSATTVTGLTDDSISGQISLPFSFPFFVKNYSNIYIHSNGGLSFVNDGYDYYGYNLTDMMYRFQIVPYYVDLNIGAGGTIKYETQGTAPNRKFIVEFNAMYIYGGGGATNTTQAVLYENGTIDLHYISVSNVKIGTGGIVGLNTAVANGYETYDTRAISNVTHRYTFNAGVALPRDEKLVVNGNTYVEGDLILGTGNIANAAADISLKPGGDGNVYVYPAQTGWNAAIRSAGAAADINLNLVAKGAGLVLIDGASALSTTSVQQVRNKMMIPRYSTIAVGSTSVTPAADSFDCYTATGMTANLTINNATIGTLYSVIGDGSFSKLLFRFKDNGTARTLTWGTEYRAIGVLLPTTTVANKWLYVGVVRNGIDSKWDIIAVSQEA